MSPIKIIAPGGKELIVVGEGEDTMRSGSKKFDLGSAHVIMQVSAHPEGESPSVHVTAHNPQTKSSGIFQGRLSEDGLVLNSVPDYRFVHDL